MFTTQDTTAGIANAAENN